MKKQWVLVSYWTPEGNEQLVAQVDNLEKAILNKQEHDFVKLEYVRWINDYDFEDEEIEEILEEAAAKAKAKNDEESCCCGCDCEDDGEDDCEDFDFDDDDDDDDDDEIMRLEDDFIYGTDNVMYLKRENIINVCPIKPEYATFWDLTIAVDGDEEEAKS